MPTVPAARAAAERSRSARRPAPRRAGLGLTTLLATLVLAGCAGFSPDGGRDRVQALARERTGLDVRTPHDEPTRAAARERVDQLLGSPLSAEAAAEIALLNNPALQAAQAGLGIAEAERVRAGRLPGLTFGFSRMSGHDGLEIERALGVNLLGLLTLPQTSRIGQQRFEQAQWQLAADTVALAAEARKAWIQAVAARQLLRQAERVHEAADTAHTLAGRMAEAGHFSPLERLREQAFRADASATLTRARHQVQATREALVRTLGLQAQHGRLQLPDRLPELPARAPDEPTLEQTALARRLDLQAARQGAEASARALGLSGQTRWLDGLHAGLVRQSTADGSARGWELEAGLPLDALAGSSTRAEAAARHAQQLQQLAALEVQAQSEAREAGSAYRAAWELARLYRDEVVPLRQQISEQQLLLYNGMLASVFDLLADAREQAQAVSGAIEALRAHWLAAADLQLALQGRSPGALGAPGPATSPAAASRGDAH
ncbi:MAG: hypothetical protein RIQ53_4602 [Pseudomonadota bacterium]